MTFERSIDRCVRCGFCLPACPTYRLTDDEESSPRGRIALARALREQQVQPDRNVLATFGECVGCRACESSCPSGVLYEEVLLYGREELARVTSPLPWHVQALLFTIRSPLRLRLAQILWWIGGNTARRLARFMPFASPSVALLASLPAPTRDRVPAREGARAAIHRGCLMDIFWTETNARAAQLMEEAGTPTQLLPVQTGCCGALHAHQGDRATARRLAQRIIASFEATGADTLINLAGGCSAFISSYPDLFEPSDPWHARAEAVAHALKDVASLLVTQHHETWATNERTTYQDSCHLRHGLKVWREPRALLQATSAYMEMPGADQCCGSAGVYNLLRPDIAGRLLQDKVREIQAIHPDVVVTSNPGCELQLRLGIRQSGLPVRVQHLVDYLFEQRPRHAPSGIAGETPQKIGRERHQDRRRAE